MEAWAAGLLGVLITVSVALLGAWIQSRREHSRWIREQRFEAYVAFAEYMHRLRLARERFERRDKPGAEQEERDYERGLVAEHEAAQFKEATEALGEWSSAWKSRIGVVERIRLLGPRSVHGAADALMGVDPTDTAAVKSGENALDTAMRVALGIRDFDN